MNRRISNRAIRRMSWKYRNWYDRKTTCSDSLGRSGWSAVCLHFTWWLLNDKKTTHGQRTRNENRRIKIGVVWQIYGRDQVCIRRPSVRQFLVYIYFIHSHRMTDWCDRSCCINEKSRLKRDDRVNDKIIKFCFIFLSLSFTSISGSTGCRQTFRCTHSMKFTIFILCVRLHCIDHLNKMKTHN